MPELRRDPITDRCVYIAEERAGRPNDFSLATPRSGGGPSFDAGGYRDNCPFCAGNEARTPQQAAAICDDNGQWLVRAVPNKYPAVLETADYSAGPFGRHEVIVESPSHFLDVVDLGEEQLTRVLRMIRDRVADCARDSRLRHVTVFKNCGPAAGASLAHVHSQLTALPFVPQAMQAELEGAARLFDQCGGCGFCELLERELALGARAVVRRDGFVVVCPFAGRQPYEMWLFPEQHAARFDQLADDQLAPQATVLLETLSRLAVVLPTPAYNLLLHTGPLDGSGADSYHWHWELVPRVAQLAGLEWGAGVHINPLSPERAAEQLRAAAFKGPV